MCEKNREGNRVVGCGNTITPLVKSLTPTTLSSFTNVQNMLFTKIHVPRVLSQTFKPESELLSTYLYSPNTLL